MKLSLEYQDFEDLFKKKEGEVALSEYKLWDYEISIEDGKIFNYYRGLIPLFKKEEDFLKDYIEKYLAKGFI